MVFKCLYSSSISTDTIVIDGQAEVHEASGSKLGSQKAHVYPHGHRPSCLVKEFLPKVSLSLWWWGLNLGSCVC